MRRSPADQPQTVPDQHAPGRDGPDDRSRMIPPNVGVLGVVVRVQNEVRVRMDLTHAGTPDQQLSLAIGQVLIYLTCAGTAEAMLRGWRDAGVLAERLAPVHPGRRHPLTIGPSTASVLVRLAGLPRLVTALEPGKPATATTPAIPPMLRMTCTPLHWQIADRTAYVTMRDAWRRAAHLLGATTIHNPD